ncbi:MAG TPA: sensor histidine kinase [Trebonia sp.]
MQHTKAELREQTTARRRAERIRRVREADRARPWLLDSLLAGVMLLLGFGTIRPGTPTDVFGHATSVPVAFIAATAAAQSLPLAWRRRVPLAVFWIVLAVCLLQVSFRLALRSDLSLMIVLYGVARYAPPRRAHLPLAAAGTLAAIVVVVFRVPHLLHQTPFALFFLCCAAAAAGGLGLAGRARQAQLTAMADRAARLETEHDQRAQLATATERARISREMHDIIGHNLAIVIGLADGAAALAPASPERAAEAMRLIAATGRQALSELRLTLGALREHPPGDPGEPDLRPQPGIADLPGLLDRIRAAGPHITYTTDGDVATLAPGLQLAIYRITQEALTNTLRHAGPATTVRVIIDADRDQVQVTVQDTAAPGGHQPPAPDGQEGHGLAGIRERASLAGGTAHAGPQPGGGWAVHAVLPIPAGRERA